MRRSVWLILVAVVALSGCGINPVTGERELQFVSEDQEISMGQQNYVPSRQMQGGDYIVDPAVTSYVQGVGNRLVPHADRAYLPYEFVVLNNSVPNAWALPGGKIAINRGLLLELNSEAELAAVLGHEIVHAAARHGAKGVERNMLTQVALIGTQIWASEKDYGNLIVGGAQLGAALITQTYGRGAELESDYHGMHYMAAAGYDPRAAVDLQKTFVRLSQGRQTNWLQGLFSSHPPSGERVAANENTAAEIGKTGDYGRERYQAAMAPLRASADAYKKHDKAVESARSGDLRGALALAQQALRAEPRESIFYSLVGDIYRKQGDNQQASGYYKQALQRNPNYFQPHLTLGLAQQELGDFRGAERSFLRSIELLPNAIAYHALGNLALRDGRKDEAVKYLQEAAVSNSPEGQDAKRKLALLELQNDPGKYLQTQKRVDENGNVVVLLGNRAPVAVTDIELDLIVLDASGRRVEQSQPVQIRQQLQPGTAMSIPTQIGPVTDQAQLDRVQIRIRSATPVQ